MRHYLGGRDDAPGDVKFSDKLGGGLGRLRGRGDGQDGARERPVA